MFPKVAAEAYLWYMSSADSALEPFRHDVWTLWMIYAVGEIANVMCRRAC
jgi:hypothetical protein